MRIRRTTTFAIAATAIITLAACSSSTTAESTTAPAPAAAAASAPTAPASADPAPSTCPQFSMTAAHMATDWHYLNINLGTSNDEAPTLADLTSGVASLKELAPTCAPKAVDAINEFGAAVEAIQPIYTTKPTGADVKKVNDALAAMQKTGAEMFVQIGQSDYAWQ